MNKIELIEFKKRFREALNDNGISQKDIAEQLSISENTIGRWFNGVREPGLFHVGEMCKILDINVDWLLFGRGDKRGLPIAYAGLPEVYEKHKTTTEVAETSTNYARLGRLVDKISKLPENEKEKLLDILEMQIEMIKKR